MHIAAGAIVNARGEVLVCQRPGHKIYPGEWEFPGGKVEPGEAVAAALARELREELGIRVVEARPLIRVCHEYPELSVDLDTWLVTACEGEPRSHEHPAIAWVAPGQLPRWPLLAADRPIVNALRLPPQLVFTPPLVAGAPAAIEDILASAGRVPAGLLRLRLPAWPQADYRSAARRIAAAIAGNSAGLLVDRDPADVEGCGAAGFHATAARLQALRARPVPAARWFGASVHAAAGLARARELGADYAVLGPVRATATHPAAPALGWGGFERLARHAGLPVYAIGGLGPRDLEQAFRHGAQGVAGISAYWRGVAPGGSGGASGSGSSGIE